MRSHFAAALVATSLLAGCSFDSLVGVVSPYRIDVRQGNYVDQEMVSQLRRGMTRDQVMNDVLLAKQPTKRFVQVEEVGALAAFLCREEAGNVTGSNWSIDGGWTAD